MTDYEPASRTRKKPVRRTKRTPTDSRKFKGIWLPAWIYLDTSMGWTKKILWLEIDSLDNEHGCTKRNKGFADFLGVSERMVSKLIGELVEEGRIYMDFRDGTRVLSSRMEELAPEGWNKSSRGVEQKFQGGRTKVPSLHIEGTIKETNKGGTHPDRARIIDTIHQAHLTAYGTKPLWTKRDLAQLDQLVEILEHPLAEIQARSKNWLAWHRLYKETNGKKGRWQADTALTGRTIGTLWDRIAEPPEPGGTSNGDLLQAKHKTIRQESW